ncbi:MAG: flagellar biosynthesis anti-sigma factor FlgM [Desulfobulbaceae bacterium]|nr:flagellar biosynthesis anti-sigma factor FlgM [Desulfobulbaceae bacterium]
MKLTGLIPQIKTDNKIQKSGNVASEKAVVKTSVAVGGDRVELSSGSRDVLKMQEILQETPEVRKEKVEEFKRQIEEGTYQVDSRQVADKMMWSLLSD